MIETGVRDFAPLGGIWPLDEMGEEDIISSAEVLFFSAYMGS